MSVCGGGMQASVVLQLVPRGPAAKAGIRVGDVVTWIDGVPTKDLTGPQRVDKILGYGMQFCLIIPVCAVWLGCGGL